MRFYHNHTFEDGTVIYIKHEPEIIPIFKRIVKEFDPQLVIELGFYYGGITKLIEETCNARIFAYDNNPAVLERMTSYLPTFKRTEFFIEDVLSRPKMSIIKLLRRPERKLLYCDNGQKAIEVNMYCRHLNVGDLVGAHDWGEVINYENVYHSLTGFKDHPANEELAAVNAGSRFWLRTQYWQRKGMEHIKNYPRKEVK